MRSSLLVSAISAARAAPVAAGVATMKTSQTGELSRWNADLRRVATEPRAGLGVMSKHYGN